MKTASDGDNVIMSPFSISAVVSMVLAGAKGNTAEQIRAGLALPADEHLLAACGTKLCTSNKYLKVKLSLSLFVSPCLD